MAENRVIYDFFGALRLVAIEAAARDMGVHVRTLSALLRSLSIPLIHIGKRSFFDPVQLLISMKCVSRIGQPDFMAPGSKALKRGASSKHPAIRTLDPATLRDNLTPILAEIAYGKKLLTFKTQEETMRYARRAAERLVKAGFAMIPDTARRRMESAALRKHLREHGKDPLELLKPEHPRS